MTCPVWWVDLRDLRQFFLPEPRAAFECCRGRSLSAGGSRCWLQAPRPSALEGAEAARVASGFSKHTDAVKNQPRRTGYPRLETLCLEQYLRIGQVYLLRLAGPPFLN